MNKIDIEQNPFILFNKETKELLAFSELGSLVEYAKPKSENKTSKRFIDGRKVSDRALWWQGRDFLPGQTEQCCNFVRYVLKEVGYTIGVTTKPSDGIETSSGYANSLAGDDIGLLVSKKDLQPGDLILFKNTYGNWPEGTITHVGIYTGDGWFIHRPTVSKPVVKSNLTEYGNWREGRRLYL